MYAPIVKACVNLPFPVTSNLYVGVTCPIPTLPPESIVIFSVSVAPVPNRIEPLAFRADNIRSSVLDRNTISPMVEKFDHAPVDGETARCPSVVVRPIDIYT